MRMDGNDLPEASAAEAPSNVLLVIWKRASSGVPAGLADEDLAADEQRPGEAGFLALLRQPAVLPEL